MKKNLSQGIRGESFLRLLPLFCLFCIHRMVLCEQDNSYKEKVGAGAHDSPLGERDASGRRGVAPYIGTENLDGYRFDRL